MTHSDETLTFSEDDIEIITALHSDDVLQVISASVSEMYEAIERPELSEELLWIEGYEQGDWVFDSEVRNLHNADGICDLVTCTHLADGATISINVTKIVWHVLGVVTKLMRARIHQCIEFNSMFSEKGRYAQRGNELDAKKKESEA